MNDENLSTFSSDILVVDDVPENLKLLMNLLTPMGYKVRPASNGAEALDAVMEKKPDLILLDIKMPGMDGFEVCKRLKADSQSKEIPIIFISAMGETADKMKAFHAGGVDYITKPFQEEEVLMRVQTHVELHRIRRNLEGIVAEQTLNLRMSEERYKESQQLAHLGHWELDISKNELFWSEEIYRIFEIDPEKFGASYESLLEQIHPEDRETVNKTYSDSVKNKTPYNITHRLLLADGKIKYVHEKCRTEYDESAEPVRSIGTVQDITERKRAEKTISDQLAFEQLVSELSGQFVNLPAEEIDSAITQGLGRVAEFIDADRASIVQPEGDDYNFSHYWTRQGISPSPSQAASMGLYPWLAKQVLGGNAVVFSQLDDLSADAEEDRQRFTKLGIQSLLSLPLVANEVPVGAVSFTTVERQCHWHEAVIERMKMVAVLLSHALERKRSQIALEEQLKFQDFVSNIAKRFVGLSSVNSKQARQTALAEIGRFFKADAVRLYRLSPQGDIIEMRNAWVSEDSVVVEETAEMYKMKYPHLAAHYLQGETIVYGCPDECPQLPDLLKILKYAKIVAGVGVPLEIDDSGVDVFALAKTQSEHVWPKDIVKYCKFLGQVLLSAARRKEAEVKLHDSYDEIKLLKERLEMENIHLREEVQIRYNHGEIVGDSQAIKSVLDHVDKVAKQDASVLILGETGTGKELLAHAIHNSSLRKERVMIKVNCAALPATLVESELFGREKGAFTGALARRAGRFEAADKSTIFLDEIGDLPLEMQAKLLRVLHDGQFERLGSTETVTVDVRVIAATNRELEKAVRENRFRKDLYYRLSVFPITIPPLRERKKDIPQLTWTFIKYFGEKMGKSVEKISKKTMVMLQNYHWPGNVRELKNVIERAMILNTDPTLCIDRIQTADLEAPQLTTLEDVERNHILQVLERAEWKVSGKSGAAEILGLKESTLRARMGKLGIKRNG